MPDHVLLHCLVRIVRVKFMDQEKRVLDYLMAHPQSNHRQVAKCLDIPDNEAFRLISGLQSKGMIKLDVAPLDKDVNLDCSCYYSARVIKTK